MLAAGLVEFNVDGGCVDPGNTKAERLGCHAHGLDVGDVQLVREQLVQRGHLYAASALRRQQGTQGVALRLGLGVDVYLPERVLEDILDAEQRWGR